MCPASRCGFLTPLRRASIRVSSRNRTFLPSNSIGIRAFRKATDSRVGVLYSCCFDDLDGAQVSFVPFLGDAVDEVLDVDVHLAFGLVIAEDTDSTEVFEAHVGPFVGIVVGIQAVLDRGVGFLFENLTLGPRERRFLLRGLTELPERGLDGVPMEVAFLGDLARRFAQLIMIMGDRGNDTIGELLCRHQSKE